uniref:Uncharacterized protein n=1 Tax=Glossina pallidipes TaxID=7398 RepID=A0A1A9ZM37_GLOPL
MKPIRSHSLNGLPLLKAFMYCFMKELGERKPVATLDLIIVFDTRKVGQVYNEILGEDVTRTSFKLNFSNHHYHVQSYDAKTIKQFLLWTKLWITFGKRSQGGLSLILQLLQSQSRRSRLLGLRLDEYIGSLSSVITSYAHIAIVPITYI